MRLQFSPAAIQDIQSITAYTLETWGAVQADRYLDALWGTLEELRHCPGNFKLRPELAEGCRSALFGRHVIFFFSKDEAIFVIRVLHSSMDFEQHL